MKYTYNNCKHFYRGKTVLITGHSGFKGTWLSIWLNNMGANVIGYSLEAPNKDDLHNKVKEKLNIINIYDDIRDVNKLDTVFKKYKPEIVFHLAAQPIVRESYNNPHYTIETNVVGALNVLECVKNNNFVKSCVIITTDKVYKNKEQKKGYVENDVLGSSDPYSTSKACVELITQSYSKSFFANSKTNIASARSGNVIGGGDISIDRIIPDCVRSLNSDRVIIVRNPLSVRPWLLVLETLYGYMLLGKQLYNNKNYSGAWNFGPNKKLIINIETLVKTFIKKWGYGEWIHINKKTNKKETVLLTLNAKKSNEKLNWKSILDFDTTIDFVVSWYKEKDAYQSCLNQITRYEKIIKGCK